MPGDFIELTLTPRTFDDEAPVPDGATPWEAQEIRTLWSMVLDNLQDVTVQAHGLHCWISGAAPDRFETDQRDVGQLSHVLPREFMGGALAYKAMQAQTNMARLRQMIEGVLHRLAVEARRRP